MLRYAIGAAALALAVASIDPPRAQRVKAGVLDLRRLGWHRASSSARRRRCPACSRRSRPVRNRSIPASISKFGLDIGATSGGVMVWGVFTDSVGPGAGFLAGDYFGATGEATVAAGLGANVLVGGSNRTVALQPLSVDSTVGLNLAVGVAELHLRSGP